jgi:hypothetical protein
MLLICGRSPTLEPPTLELLSLELVGLAMTDGIYALFGRRGDVCCNIGSSCDAPASKYGRGMFMKEKCFRWLKKLELNLAPIKSRSDHHTFNPIFR